MYTCILLIVLILIINIVKIISAVFFPPTANVFPIGIQSIMMLPEEYSMFMDIPYFKSEFYAEYVTYMESNSNLSVEDVITHVNMGIHVPFYTEEARAVENTDDILLIANKVYQLPEGYEPEDLVIVDDYRSQTMRSEAAESFQEMKLACKELGFDILGYSGYRDEEYQELIYNNMVNEYGQEHTDEYVSRVGHSEHQTGLAIDISINGGNYNDAHLSEYYDEFLAVLPEYGFIIRYPEGKEELTGYGYESWHLRYVGVEVAKEITTSDLTLDEYVARLN